MEQTHVFNLISDYVLGLLPVAERRLVERHAADCTACRQQLVAERELSQRVRHTLAALPTPSPARLARRQPPPPPARVPLFFQAGWYKAWVTVGVLLAIFAGTLYLRPNTAANAPVWADPAPYALATATEQPTATTTVTATATQVAGSAEIPSATPTAAATPIAALPAPPGSQ